MHGRQRRQLERGLEATQIRLDDVRELLGGHAVLRREVEHGDHRVFEADDLVGLERELGLLRLRVDEVQRDDAADDREADRGLLAQRHRLGHRLGDRSLIHQRERGAEAGQRERQHERHAERLEREAVTLEHHRLADEREGTEA